MPSGPWISLDALAAAVPDGCLLAVPKDEGGVSIAATLALIRRGARELRLLCVPTSGLQSDLLIGAGCVAAIECGAVTLDEFGPAPRFRAAAESGAIDIVDSTCPAIYAALQAGEKGSPFASLRGIIGSDVERHRRDWRIIDNPFADGGDPVLLIPAIRPDIALFHARLGDAHGNVWVGNKRECVIAAHAARRALVTVEAMYEGDLAADDRLAAGTIADVYVDGCALAPRGAWPLALGGAYPADADTMRRYAEAARSADGFANFLADVLQSGPATAA